MNNDIDILNDRYMYIQTIEFFIDLVKEYPDVTHAPLINILFNVDNLSTLDNINNVDAIYVNILDNTKPELLYLIKSFFDYHKRFFNHIVTKENAFNFFYDIDKNRLMLCMSSSFDVDELEQLCLGDNIYNSASRWLVWSNRDTFTVHIKDYLHKNPYLLAEYNKWETKTLQDLNIIHKPDPNLYTHSTIPIDKKYKTSFINEIVKPNISFPEIFDLSPNFWIFVRDMCYYATTIKITGNIMENIRRIAFNMYAQLES